MEVHQNPARCSWGSSAPSSPCSGTSQPSWRARWQPKYFALKGIKRGWWCSQIIYSQIKIQGLCSAVWKDKPCKMKGSEGGGKGRSVPAQQPQWVIRENRANESHSDNAGLPNFLITSISCFPRRAFIPGCKSLSVRSALPGATLCIPSF